jgi:Domain of unknown function (DUF4340)
MSPLNRGLLGALGVQALLVLVTHWPERGPTEPRDLLSFSADDVQTITIIGRKAKADTAEPANVKLTNADGGWVIDTAAGYPASTDLMSPLLESLGKLKVTDPITTTAASHASLEVADDQFTRKVEVTSKGGEKATFFLGASQGKTTHVRMDGDTDVYAVTGFTAWSVAEHANRYFDRDFLKVDPAEVDSVTLVRTGVGTVTFTHDKAADTWTMSPNPSGKPLDTNATNGFVRSLLNVRMVEPNGLEVKPEMGFDAPAAVVSWTVTSGEPATTSTSTYKIGAAVPDQTGRYYLKSETNPYVLQVLKGSTAGALEKPFDSVYGQVDAGPLTAPPPGFGP